MKVGILGAHGFVGKALQRQCQSSPSVSEVRVLGRTDFDFADPESWGEKLAGLDCVVNAAARIDGDTFEIFSTNCLFARDFALHLNNLGIGRLVNLSTGAVYGRNRAPAAPSFACHPVGDYPVSKYLGERVLSDVFRGHLNHLRIYYPYGPAQKLPRLVPRLIDNITHSRTITCDARGGPFLSMSHVDDVASVVLEHFVLESMDGGVYNIASPHRISVLDIVTEIARLTGATPDIFRRDGEDFDVLSVPYGRWSWRPFSLVDCLVPRPCSSAACG